MGKTGGMHGRSGDRDDGGDHDAEDWDESDDSDDEDDGDERCPEGAQEKGGFGEYAVRVRRSERLRAGWYGGEDAAEGTVRPKRREDYDAAGRRRRRRRTRGGGGRGGDDAPEEKTRGWRRRVNAGLRGGWQDAAESRRSRARIPP